MPQKCSAAKRSAPEVQCGEVFGEVRKRRQNHGRTGSEQLFVRTRASGNSDAESAGCLGGVHVEGMVADIHLGVLGSENVGLAKAPGISVDLVGGEAEALKVLSGKGCELSGDDDRATGNAGCDQWGCRAVNR